MIKQKLHALCLVYADKRIADINQAIQFAQDSANEETKSSAGDKYETSRAMAQLEIEKNSLQLTEAKKLKQILLQLDPSETNNTIRWGSLVITNHGRFYISISAGQFAIDGETYFSISQLSPIALRLFDLKKGDQFSFNGKQYVINEVL